MCTVADKQATSACAPVESQHMCTASGGDDIVSIDSPPSRKLAENGDLPKDQENSVLKVSHLRDLPKNIKMLIRLTLLLVILLIPFKQSHALATIESGHVVSREKIVNGEHSLLP